MIQNSFILYTNYKPVIDLLTIKERGILLTAIFDYLVRKERDELPLRVKIAFEFIKNQIDLDRQKYEKIVERNQANAIKHSEKAKMKSNPQL